MVVLFEGDGLRKSCNILCLQTSRSQVLRSVFSVGGGDTTIGNPTLQPHLHTDQGNCTLKPIMHLTILILIFITVTLDVYTVEHQSCQLVVTREAVAKDIQYHVMKELGLPSSNYQLCEVKSSGGKITLLVTCG